MRALFSVGVVSDEVSLDPEDLLAFLSAHRLDHVELNFVAGGSVCDLALPALEDLRRRLERAGTSVSLIGSRAFRGDLDDEPAFEQDLDHVARAARAARVFGVDLVRVFSFRRRPRLDPDDAALLGARLVRAADLAQRLGVGLLCENTGSGNLATTEETRSFLGRVAHGNLGLLWDPANAVGAGDPLPAPLAFALLRPWIRQVHVKNVTLVDGLRSWASVAAGAIDFPALLATLARAGGPWPLTLDTHYRLPGADAAASTLQCLRELRQALRDCDAAGA